MRAFGMWSMTMPEFWKSAGTHLLERTESGWLAPTPDYLRAYYTRPEVHPVEESCAGEHRLFEALMADPMRAVEPGELQAIEDADARDNYCVVLAFRDLLLAHGTLEGAYLALMKSGNTGIPPLFVDQIVHAVLKTILAGVADPIRIRAAELFFRQQNVSIEDGRVMLADEETVEMYATSGGMGGLGQLLMEASTPMRSVELDVIDEDNKEIYWGRSDRFDTVIDLRFTQPGLDALARVMEAWIAHFTGKPVRILPMQSIKDERWSWHIGLDSEASRLLNALYEGEELALDEVARIIALFRLEFRDQAAVIDAMRGKPVYLGLAVNPAGKLRMKPQNLLINLPLRGEN